eukprot:m.430042 g.430042  ORF g.430042 m.430042 type:complete len:65 (+) comp21391_c1_seq3:1587-1781(+)
MTLGQSFAWNVDSNQLQNNDRSAPQRASITEKDVLGECLIDNDGLIDKCPSRVADPVVLSDEIR